MKTASFISRAAVSFLCCLILLFPLKAQAADRVQQTDENIVIVIDPGHGGANEGTIENGFLEKSMTLITAQAMYEELCKYDNVTVYLTRTEDVDMSLKERALFAEERDADFLFSIHYNASVDHDLFGSEVWISAAPPFNAYGYQFGYEQMLVMEEMGLTLRGIKTKLNDRGTDYYGIIRESTALKIPSVIIEHCHVDEERDVPFCDTAEKQKAFGRADAEAVARYFGLSSETLKTDYSTESRLPAVNKEEVVLPTLADKSAPDQCSIEIVEADYDTGMLQVQVTAADPDSPLLYYDYSYNGGMTYSPLQMWPESNVLAGTCADTVSITMQIPYGARPLLVVRVYQMFDLFTESNRIPVPHTFRYGESTSEAQTENSPGLSGGPEPVPVLSDGGLSETEGSLLFSVLAVSCLVLSLFLLFGIVLRSIKKCRRHRRKQDGNRRNHPR